jgi:hypothetical protein
MSRKSTPFAIACAAYACFQVGVARAEQACEQIESGTLLRSDGQPVVSGSDERGYDYEQRKFDGAYCQTLANPDVCDYQDVWLTMLWNEAWISSQDCDGDHYLDRHSGFASYRGSGAELTNIMRGTMLENEQACEWHYVYWISAAPLDAQLTNGVWYKSDGTLLGSQIWTDFAIVGTLYEEVCGDALAND